MDDEWWNWGDRLHWKVGRVTWRRLFPERGKPNARRMPISISCMNDFSRFCVACLQAQCGRLPRINFLPSKKLPTAYLQPCERLSCECTKDRLKCQAIVLKKKKYLAVGDRRYLDVSLNPVCVEIRTIRSINLLDFQSNTPHIITAYESRVDYPLPCILFRVLLWLLLDRTGTEKHAIRFLAYGFCFFNRRR